MNKLIRAINDLDLNAVRELLDKDPRWLGWSEGSGKNALHYLCGLNVSGYPAKVARTVDILELLLARGIDINSVHEIPDEGSIFPATPLWYAYARGRNESLVRSLLERGADPQNCMFAIAWNDDVEAAEVFKSYGATTDVAFGDSTPFFAAYLWRRFAVAEWFLWNGANVDHQDAKGNTALFHAVKRRYDTERVRLLLKFGANPQFKNKEGTSARDLAEQSRRRKILSLLDSPTPPSGTSWRSRHVEAAVRRVPHSDHVASGVHASRSSLL
jgi:ankyrin repeat protein